MNQLHIAAERTELYARFTEFISSLLARQSTVSIALSGGETPKALFDYWAAQPDVLDWNRILFFWGDERCVAPTDSQSNYGMTKQHLLDKVPVPATNIFRIEGENNPESEATRYGKLLCEVLPQKDGLPQLDVVMLGLGTDGHTVSIFPHQIGLWDAPQPCVVAQHPDSGQLRVSLSGGVVNNARYAVFLATGANKQEKVQAIIANRSAVQDVYPAARVQPTSGQLHWFLDDEAAALISKP